MALLLLAVGVGWAATLDVGQPIPFSHRQHMRDARMRCVDCHKLAASGEVFSIPQGKSCFVCHAETAKNSPAIRDLKTYVDDKEPVPWVRVYQIPSFVNFDHKTHIDAGAACSACHGPVETRDRVVRETDLSMDACVSCHLQHGAKTGCHTCHDLDE